MLHLASFSLNPSLEKAQPALIALGDKIEV